MNLATTRLNEGLQEARKPVDPANRIDLYKSLLQGLVIRGEFDWNDPHPYVLRCWNAAKTAAEVMERT